MTYDDTVISRPCIQLQAIICATLAQEYQATVDAAGKEESESAASALS